MRKEFRFLLALAAFALLLRLFRIGVQSLWVDELFTITVSTPDTGMHIWDYLKYNIGAATVFFVYRWTARWLGPRVAVIVSVLFALNPLHVYYSQEVRNYALLLFFGMMATHCLHRLLEKESQKTTVVYALSMAAAALCNFTAAFLYVVHAAIFLLRKGLTRRRLGRWVFVSLIIAVLISPWIYRVYEVIDFGKLVTPVQPGELDTTQRLRGDTTFSPAAIPYAFYAFSTGFSLGPSLRELHEDVNVRNVVREHAVAVVWVALLFGGLAALGVRRLFLTGGPWFHVLLYIGVPFALTLVLNWQNAKAFNVRYVLFAMPAFVCLVALGVDGLRPRLRSLSFALVVLTLAISLGHYYFDGRYAREDVRSAAREVESHIEPGDCVIVPTVFEVFEHYFTRPNPVRPVFASARIPRESVDRQLASALAECDGVWYVRAREWANDPDGYILDSLGQRMTPLQTIEFDGVTVFRFVPGHLQQ
jgi:hypothetical protein